jgi:hypothetical protein
MRIADVFTMGGGGRGYDGGYGHNGFNNGYDSENPCYWGRGCVRNYDTVDKYCDPRSRRHGLAHILGGLLGIL